MIRLRPQPAVLFCVFLLLASSAVALTPTQTGAAQLVPKFPLKKSGPELERRTQAGAFLGVLGRKSAIYGYEHRALEAWVYPLQILDRFELSFRLEGYPLEFKSTDTAALINVRPEATTITYTHAAFTVRQTIYAPVGEPGVIMLIEADSALPLGVTVSFRPRLKLMWPAGLMTGSPRWDETERAYFITEESKRFVGVVGSPAARDVSVMPYQEEPRDVPARFNVDLPPEQLKAGFIPVVIAGSVKGRGDASATYARLLANARELYEKNVEHYTRLLNETATVLTPDARVNEAFQWAKVGIDKGVVENPLLGTGLVAGFRTAVESERPGFAWFFGRDALWTALALNSYGDFATTRAALDFLKKFQRADGKIPHEISQSASLVPWFTDYEYPWASADATPLYIIAHADLFRASGDAAFLRSAWESVVKARRFTAATDTDGNALVENTTFGHGWVEGGALYPPHEEIYMQGVWVEALEGFAEMADALDEEELADDARRAAERTRDAVEKTFWMGDAGFYAFATNLPRELPRKAEPGPNRAVRQSRMNELDKKRLWDEDTVMPAVPLWWGVLDEERAQEQIDRLGSGHLATDWGARLVSDESRLYDPLSYHHGSVWPLFTGWASVGAYRYGRPHVGFQALMANVLLKRQNALGFVTELLSGDFNAPFGRSSHHQVWSEAMVVTPLVRGLLGIEFDEGDSSISFAPQLPADWDSVEARGVAAGASLFDFSLRRGGGQMTIRVSRHPSDVKASARNAKAAATSSVTLAPAFPLDARVRAVRVNGRGAQFETMREGDVQRLELSFDVSKTAEVSILYDEGTDVYLPFESPAPGSRSTGLRVLRSRAEGGALRLLLEGRGGRTYTLRVKTQHEIENETAEGEEDSDEDADGEEGETTNAQAFNAKRVGPGEFSLSVSFPSPTDGYVRREFVVPLRSAR